MVRQKGDELPLPKTDSPAPVAMPEAPKEPPKTPEPAAVQRKRRARSTGRAWPRRRPRRTTSRSRRRERWPGLKSSRANRCPRRTLSPGFPRRPRRKPPTSRRVPKRPTGLRSKAARWSDPIATARRCPRPSSRMPACRPSLPPRRAVPRPAGLEAVSTVPVEKSDTSRAPLGPTIASSGNQDFGRRIDALSLAAGRHRRSRQGPAIDRRRLARGPGRNPLGIPRVEPQPRSVSAISAGPAGGRIANGRRRFRSRRRPGGQAAADPVRDGIGFPRSREESPRTPPFRGWRNGVQPRRIDQYARCRPADRHAALRRQRHAARQLSQRRCCRALAKVTCCPATTRLPAATWPRPWAVDPADRAASKERSDGDDNGVGSVPRARSEAFDLRPTATPAGPVAGTANATGGPLSGGTSQVPELGMDRRLVGRLDPTRGLAASGGGRVCRPRHWLASFQPDRAVGNRLVYRCHVAAAIGSWRPWRRRRRAVGSNPIRRWVGHWRHRPRQQPGCRQRPGS